MSRAEGIRRLGFKRWYERQLIESHLYFVTWFLCLILICACIEGMSLRGPGWEPALLLALLFGGGAVGLASLRRYSAILQRAEQSRGQSTCSQCGTYARFQVLDALADEQPETWLRVRCGKCGHEWIID